MRISLNLFKVRGVYMKKEINFGIGFITGRPNVCRIINSYYKHLVEQVQDIDV